MRKIEKVESLCAIQCVSVSIKSMHLRAASSSVPLHMTYVSRDVSM